MNELVLYALISLLVGIGLTVLLFRFLVIKNFKMNESRLRDELESKENEIKDVLKQREQLYNEVITAKSDLHHAHAKLQEQTEQLEKLNEKLTKDFENIANQVVNKSSKMMQDRHEEKLMSLLNPFKEKIATFEKKVEETNVKRAEDNAALKEQLNHLRELNKNIGDEAKNLTSALKGDKKLQGNWGENSLERIIQAAGLERDKHYKREVNLKDDDNSNFRADYIIYLPDDKNLIIDSKVSLNAYSNYFKAESDKEVNLAIAEHVANVKNHIAGLSRKNYSQLHGVNSPDYVIMYMPIDSALGMAMMHDSELFDFALNKNIVLVSNNTLLATLKTVSFIWRQELQRENAVEIAKQGGALYDKFVGFVDTLAAVGKKMDDAKSNYEKAMGQLHSGKDNLVRKTERLKELGVKTTKSIPDKLKDQA